MTTTDSPNECRDAFQRWVDQGPHYGERYITDYAWKAWQAAWNERGKR